MEDKIEDKIRKHGDEEMNNDKWRTFILGEMKILPSLVMYTNCKPIETMGGSSVESKRDNSNSSERHSGRVRT